MLVYGGMHVRLASTTKSGRIHFPWTLWTHVRKVIRHVEVDSEMILFERSSTLKNDLSLLLSLQCNVSSITGIVRHTAYAYAYGCMPDKAHDGQNVALKWQVNCWRAWSSKKKNSTTVNSCGPGCISSWGRTERWTSGILGKNDDCPIQWTTKLGSGSGWPLQWRSKSAS